MGLNTRGGVKAAATRLLKKTRKVSAAARSLLQRFTEKAFDRMAAIEPWQTRVER
jgi:hypothetical protein